MTSASGSRRTTTRPTSSGSASTRRRPASPASRGPKRSTRRSASAGSTASAGAEELLPQGRIQPSGLDLFEGGTDDTPAIYAYEQRPAARLEPQQEREF